MLWASAVLYPVLVSLLMFAFAVAILYRCTIARPVTVQRWDWVGWLLASIVIIVSFCLGGTHVTEPNYKEYFHWPIFAVGYVIAVAACLGCLARSPSRT